MKKKLPAIVIVFLGLTAFTIAAAPAAYLRGDHMAGLLFLVMAVIFWKRAHTLAARS